jgi:ribonucleoside-diphosphate reductase alpha chain
VAEFSEVPEDVKTVFVTSHDIKPEWHIKMQAAFQKFTDNAVSKTINLPEEATVEDVETAYWTAYQLDCKGVTVYRDGCRKGQVLSFKKETKPSERVTIQDRPDILEGFTEKIKTGYGNLYVTVNTLGDKPFEVFAQIGKSGYTTMADTEAVCRLISLAFRSGLKVEDVAEQLIGIGGSSQILQEGGIVTSIPDAIAKVLKKHFVNGKNNKNFRKDIDLEFCPDCGGGLIFQEGCLMCHECGFSRC